MDANGTRFLLLNGEADFTATDTPARVAFSPSTRTWKLASAGTEPALAEDAARAVELREQTRLALDGFGSEARIVVVPNPDPLASASTLSTLIAQHESSAEQTILSVPEAMSDACIGEDGVITAVVGSALWLRDARTLGDAREQWQVLDAALLHGDTTPTRLQPWRLAVRPKQGAWVLDRAQGQLALWTGSLLRRRPRRTEAAGTFRPAPEDPKTLELRILQGPGAFGTDTPVAMACSPEGSVAVLAWTADPAVDARLHLFDSAGMPLRVLDLLGLKRPFSLAWVSETRVALLALRATQLHAEALVYGVDQAGPVLPVGERYPLRAALTEPFPHGPLGRPLYASSSGPRLLVPLSLPHRSTQGAARAKVLDSGVAGTCWHRLFCEAVLPQGCGIRVELAASDDSVMPADDGFFPHDFGAVPAPRGSGGNPPFPAPRATWERQASEVPFHPGLLQRPLEFDRVGLFSVLIQRTGLNTRRLTGRYLHVRLSFHGNGKATPELAALRAYTPRFSYVRSYLPELYHEDPLLQGDSTVGGATQADFLERFIALFEGVLTPIEDRVAQAWQLINPLTAPAGALDWLAAWVGIEFDPALPESVRRKLLYFAPQLANERGTRRGLERALEIVSEGGISRGDLIVIEEYRLRRTWATILGADLADETDPLLGGITVSGNSIVGDSLILGDEHQRELMALFADRVSDTSDRSAVARFFETTAHRATVLVSQALDEDAFGRVQRMVEKERPAHVSVAVRRATSSFVVAMTALIGVDTRLGVTPEPVSVRLGRTQLGAGDRLLRAPAFHSESEGGTA